MSKQLISVQIAGLSDTGLVRQLNEDYIGFDRDLGVAVLADGIGGHKSGELASRLAVYSALDDLRERLGTETSKASSDSEYEDQIRSIINDSNSMIFNAAEVRKGHKGMGTTVVATLVRGEHLYAGYVGDSRLYLYRDENLTRLTRDHSVAQELIDKGSHTEDQVRQFKIGHILTRALGIGERVEVDTLRHDAKHKDIFILCSDGLWDMLGDWRILDVLKETPEDLDVATKTLVQIANRNGGKDNISVILMKILKN
ncbi:MAG: protein phosphatase 2C domain-containing protein [Gammaproteobacteria bacterium]|nr:protein phosphatase 2C domain-containing protein [Gammaproteobacteria bacterium]MCY4357052.1 protein phosphatase 2C domain-containing protein [Gammaproteobacteria bacterium]